MDPERLGRVIEVIRRVNSPLSHETDVSRANEKIYDLFTALRDIREMCDEALAKAREVKDHEP